MMNDIFGPTLPDVTSTAPATLANLWSGRVIDGTFRIERALGRGGMAEVFLAHDLVLDRDVALKFLAPRLSVDPAWRSRFAAEARSMARIRHENVVQVHSFGLVDGCPYFSMEYVRGRTLADRLRESALEGPAEAISVLQAIARGLDAIHAAGLVHQDVKPSNVLLEDGGRVVVGDLGLAHPAVGVVAGASSAGTPGRMAPEQLGEVGLVPELANRTDIYQLGVLAFELLTGRLPFEAEDLQELCRMHCTSPCPRPSVVTPALGSTFDDAVLIAMAKRPEERFASAGTFVARLQAAACIGPLWKGSKDDEEVLIEEAARDSLAGEVRLETELHASQQSCKGSILAACRPLHQEIRREIRRVLELTSRARHHVEGDREACLELTRAMRALAVAVRRHVVIEQRELLPMLDRLDAWGEHRKHHVEEEHAREIEAVFNVDYYGSHHAMASDASSIARALLAALASEEADFREADQAVGVPAAQEAG